MQNKGACRFILHHYIRRYAALLPCLGAMAPAGVGHASPLDLAAFTSIAQQCGSSVAPLTLAALARTESRFEPLVVSDNSTRRSYTSQTLEEAASTAERWVARGDSVDVGLMQINSANLRRLNLSMRAALDPCQSISSAASILTNDFLTVRNAPDEQVALRDAISMYNTGNAAWGYRNGYVGRVQRAAEALAPFILTADGVAAALDASPSSEAADQTSAAPWAAPWDVWQASQDTSAPGVAGRDQTQIVVI